MKNKKLIGLTVLSTLVVAGCSCSSTTQNTYEVDGFIKEDGTKMQFASFDEFKTYLIGSGTIVFNHQADYWQINGLTSQTNKYDTEQEAINAYLNLFDPERYMAEQVVFDANGVATSIKMHVDTTTVYETNTHGWTTDAKQAYQTWLDTNYSGLYYSVNANGLDLESRSLEDLIAAFKNSINKQDKTIAQPVAKTGVVEGDFISSGGVNYTWKNQTNYTLSETVTPMPGAFMLYNGLPYQYMIEHTYTGTESRPTVVMDGAAGGAGITASGVTDGMFIRIYSKDSTNRIQTFAGQSLRNIDYVNGIDYKWNDAVKKLVINTDKYFKEDGKELPKDNNEWEQVDCNTPIGHSKSIYACFNEKDINTKTGRLFHARPAETLYWNGIVPPHNTDIISFTNVDNHAGGYNVTAKGTNRAGWYLRVGSLDLFLDRMDCSDLLNNRLTDSTLYFDKSNVNKNPLGQLTTSFAESLTSTEVNPAAFYAPGFNFTSKGIEGTDYILWDDARTYYPTTNALAGSRQLTTNQADAYVAENEYWWIGNEMHVTYTSLESAQTAAEQIVRTLVTSEWRIGTMLTPGDYYTSSTSYDDAFNKYMTLAKINQKIVENEHLDGSIPEFDRLPAYVANNPIVVYKIPGYDKYFDSKVDAFNWYKANVGSPVSKIVGADTYSVKGISAATQDELIQKVWDAYSKKVN